MLMFPTNEIKQGSNNFRWEKGAEDEALELPKGILKDGKVLVVTKQPKQ